ncbi:hypothetical protein AAUPMC_20136, partial [Pasteurella multocida subsp. multocida str. Anand1_cattle]
NHLVLRNLSLWMQSLLVIIFVFSIRFSIFLIELLLHSASFNWQEKLWRIGERAIMAVGLFTFTQNSSPITATLTYLYCTF